MANELQLNLGALRSDMKLTLHTHHAARIWRGRANTDELHGIIGLSGFVAAVTRMKRGAEQDDPYSDWWMLQVEEKLDATKTKLTELREQVELALAELPSALSIGDNLNVQPVDLPLFVHAQLGYLAVFQLAEFDRLARRIILAHHTAMIDNEVKDAWLRAGAHALRSLFSVAQRFRYSGTKRDDYAANNAAAREAREKFGQLPQDVLEGTRRSRFAPPIRRGGLAALDRAPQRPRPPASVLPAHEEALPTLPPAASPASAETVEADDALPVIAPADDLLGDD